MSRKKLYLAALIVAVVLTALIFAGPRGMKRYRDYQQSRQVEAQLHFQRAENLLKLRRYQEALAEYETVLTRYRQSEFVPKALLRTGFIYARGLRKDDLARQTYEKLIKDYPGSPQVVEAKINLLYLCQRLGRNKEVIQLSAELARDYPQQIDRDAICLAAAETYVKERNQEQALKMADQIVNKNSALVKNSQIYYGLQLSMNPLDPQPHLELARIYGGLGLAQKAAAELAIAARLKQRQNRDKDKAKTLTPAKAQKTPPAKPAPKSVPLKKIQKNTKSK